jgi:hypothetical protein
VWPATPEPVGAQSVGAKDPGMRPIPRALLLARIYVELPHRPPPFTPARGPPQVELAFDQSPAFDPSDPEPVPDHASRGAIYFDQSGADWPEPEG